jgi:apolipoprotein N-acyltransferase
MVRRLAPSIVLSVLSGVLLILSFPRFDFGFLGWIALVPLLLAIRNLSGWGAFLQGWLTGLVFFTGTLSWVVNAMHLYGKMPLAVSYPVMLLLAGYCALYPAAFAALVRRLGGRRGSSGVWTAAALWVALEWVRTFLFTGLPWALLGYTQYHNLPVIQIADMTAVYGVSFLLVLVNALLARLVEALMARIRPAEVLIPIPWFRAILVAGLVAGAVAYGHWRLDHSMDPDRGLAVRIGLVQPNIDQSQKWDTAYRRETIDRFKRLTAQAAQGADLVIWPEAATPFLFEVEADYQKELLSFVRERGVPLLFGSPAVKEEGGAPVGLLNSAYLVGGNGAVLDRYDKLHLVPFGEYIPLKEIFWFLDKLVVGIGDFLPGPGPVVMAGPGGRFGTVICFEVIFPDLVRHFVDQGADYMVTITNDAWFGRSSAPHQHFSMVVFRAVENRVAFARAANTGISGFIDADGHILRLTDIFVEGTLSSEVRIGGPRTFYTAYGDLFAEGCGILTLLALAVRWRRSGAASRRGRRAGKGPYSYARPDPITDWEH